jgi:hypothetical protein
METVYSRLVIRDAVCGNCDLAPFFIDIVFGDARSMNAESEIGATPRLVRIRKSRASGARTFCMFKVDVDLATVAIIWKRGMPVRLGPAMPRAD